MFAILSYNENSQNKNIIVKKGDVIFGYKVVDVFDDIVTIQDDKNNEILLHLK